MLISSSSLTSKISFFSKGFSLPFTFVFGFMFEFEFELFKSFKLIVWLFELVN